MRIAGYIEHPSMKITIMHMNHRFAVKFEKLGIEQVYKIRESDTIKSAEDVKKVVEPTIIEKVDSFFKDMETIRISMITAPDSSEEEFEEII